MKYIRGLYLLAIQGVFLTVQSSCTHESEQLKPQVFEPENISTDAVEYATSFSSTRTEIYFAKSNDKWGTGNMKSSIFYSIKKNNKWSEPELASFSGQYDDSDPHITNDGKTIYFISDRPSTGTDQISADIWKVEKPEEGTWGDPVRLSGPVNSPGSEYSPRTDKAGNLYFASTREGGYGQGDLYMAKKLNGVYAAPVNLGNSINTDKGEWNLEISQDGNIIIFEASDREQNLSGYGDLYISFNVDNEWSVSQNIKEINTTGSDLYPELLEAEDILYFTSSDSLKSHNTNIYSIPFKGIYKKYRKNAVFTHQ